MSILKDKKILLAVTGGIAAYKAAILVRLLVKEQAEVKVIMTTSAMDFVTPLTLSTLSKKSVEFEFKNDDYTWNNHVELALWADLMIIAPCTANTLSKMANGTCNNLVLATYLSAKSQVYIAPAMDLDMYQHQSTKENITKLEQNGNAIIPSEKGELASGLIGEGRMAEPENIVRFIKEDIKKKLPLLGKKVLVSAGPTYEYIDPVRFIGNFSSGKMGYEIAKQAANLGAEVFLVSGPSNESIDGYQIELFPVITAHEMFETMKKHFDYSDIVIMSAAVADYKVKTIASQKIKKSENELTIELEKNINILKTLAEKKDKQFLVGFALETNNEEQYAIEKLHKKNLDAIVLNSLNDKEAGFAKPSNKITIFSKNGEKLVFEAKLKTEVAKDIFTFIIKSTQI
jgi:phosphopantothenoylcysteine decarboxylase / phosphopantothenate---cysteine ligase